MSQECTHCQSAVHDTVICGRCVRVMDAHLRDVADHVEELTTVLAKDTVYAEKLDGGKSADPTIAWGQIGDQYLDQVAVELERNPLATPFSKSAAVCLHELRSTLVSWCRLLKDERGIGLPRDSYLSMAEHLRGNLRILASHEAAGEFVAEVIGLVKRITVVIDAPANRARFKLPDRYRCTLRHETGICAGHLVVTVPADESIRPTIKCQKCRREWYSTEWATVGQRLLKQKHTATPPIGPRCRSKLCPHPSCWAIRAAESDRESEAA